MSYDRDIPQSGTLLSTSQGDLLDNFREIDSGTSGTGPGLSRDHVTLSAGADAGRHLQAHMAQQASLPANATPAANEGTYYVSQTDTVGGTVSEAIFASGDIGALSLLSAVKAWGVFSSTTIRTDGFNFATVSQPIGMKGRFNVTFTNMFT